MLCDLRSVSIDFGQDVDLGSRCRICPINIYISTCRDVIVDYSKKVEKFVELIYELISEALGLHPKYLLQNGCLESWALMCHYYPPCPEPQLTLGMNKHIDPSCVTVLAQDPNISGLQVLHNNQWFDVDPLPGSFTIIGGVLLQMLTNDKLKGLWHRAKANAIGPRISVNMFFAGRITAVREFGPIKELISADSPPKYRQFTSAEMIKLAYTEIPDKPVYSFFEIHDENQSVDLYTKSDARVGSLENDQVFHNLNDSGNPVH